MQQLTLFTNNAARTRSRQTRRSLQKKGGSSNATGVRWDLWAQETDAEKEMALFFLDIRNFTPLVEKRQASDVIHIVKRLFSTFHNIIRIHRGQIIETSGDGFYAAFGFDSDPKKAANAAVKAGMAILNILEDLNERSFEKNLGQGIEVGIGIHVGKVATGHLHLGSKVQFVVMGYAVNVAARLQAATKDLNNSFIVSSAVFSLLENGSPDRPTVKATLKGVSDVCELHLIGKPYSSSR